MQTMTTNIRRRSLWILCSALMWCWWLPVTAACGQQINEEPEVVEFLLAANNRVLGLRLGEFRIGVNGFKVRRQQPCDAPGPAAFVVANFRIRRKGN